MLNKQLELTGELHQTEAKYMTSQTAVMKGTSKIGGEIYYISAYYKKGGKRGFELLFVKAL